MKTNEEKALELSGLTYINEDERYYQPRKCEIYDKCLEMAEWKDERYRWHKVADGDLPSDEETYVLRTKISGTFVGWYHDGKWWKPGYSRYEEGEVIAWLNIPKFEDTQII